MMGMFRIPFLMMDERAHVQHDRRTFWTSLLVGMAFAAGWSPCIGPILAGILAIASQQHNGEAALLLFVYSLGLAVPFLATALAIGAILPLLNRIKRFLPAIEFAAGAFLIVVGFVLVNNAFLASQDGSISLSRNRTSELVNTLVIALVAVAVLWLDQYTKHLVRRFVSSRRKPDRHPPLAEVDVRAEHARRVRPVRQQRGPADRHGAGRARALLGQLPRRRAQSLTVRIAFGMIVGGAIGNIVDRLHNGYVVDFIDFYRIWPNIFNVADSCITVGVALLLISSLATRRQPEEAGKRTDVFVARFTGVSRSLGRRGDQARRPLRVNGAPVQRQPPARNRTTVSNTKSPSATPLDRAAPKSIDIPIVYEDDDLVVVDKPAGMVTHPAHGARAARSSTRCSRTPRRAAGRRTAARTGPSARPRYVRDCSSSRKTLRRSRLWASR